MPRVVSVAVPVPALNLLSYEVPNGLPIPEIGARILVPVGSRVMTGCVIDRNPGSKQRRLKQVIDVLDLEPMLPVEVVELALWVSDYYACGPGEAIAAAMPPLAWVESERQTRITDAGLSFLRDRPRGIRREILEVLADGVSRPVPTLGRLLSARRHRPGRRGSGLHALLATMAQEGLVTLKQSLKGAPSAFKSVRVAQLTTQGLARIESGSSLGVRQREALELLRGQPLGLEVAELTRRRIASGTVRRLVELGALTVRHEIVTRDSPFSETSKGLDWDNVLPRRLTSEQQAVVDSLTEVSGSGKFSVALLKGVTGSGKTEVYKRLAGRVVESKRQVLVLVPEIALTSAVETIFRQTFGKRVAVQHSAMSNGARHDQWHRIRRGEVDVVVGTRSAVFSPLPALGLVLVDEEHDASYKQSEEAPRYNGRDVAIMRAKSNGALVILGSATPSLESHQHAVSGRYRLLTLSKRVEDRPLPSVRIVDMRKEFARSGPDVVLSSYLVDALDARFKKGEQALILLNRRGFAASLFCRQCGLSLGCPNCSVSLTFHRLVGRVRCHYCGYSRQRMVSCPECGGPYLELSGFGTERVETEVLRRWPDVGVVRLDRDTVRRKGAAIRLLERFASGKADVLVGTQMVAKGHDFQKVTLVGVVSADVGLGVADFRAAERTFQLLTQVAGRAGRGTVPGEAIVQTLYPNHYSIRFACSQAYEPFFKEEMNFRKTMQYPPVLPLVGAVVWSSSLQQSMREATDLAESLRRRRGSFQIIGPAPAPIGKLRGRYRVQLFLKGPNRREMREGLLAAVDGRTELRRRVVIDVDPVSLL